MRLNPLALAIVLTLSACAKTAVHEEAATADDLKDAPGAVAEPVEMESADTASVTFAEPKGELDKIAVVGGAQQAGVAAGRRDPAAAKAASSANERAKTRQQVQGLLAY